MVLSSGSWPFQQCFPLTLPLEVNYQTIIKTIFMLLLLFFKLEKCSQRFTEFYSNQHNGRKLSWLYNFSKGELITNCFKNRYTLQVQKLLLKKKKVFFIYFSIIQRHQHFK